jgi:toxin CcdB
MQWAVYANEGESASYAPFLVDVQADLLSDLPTRAVIPLIAAGSFGRRAQTLHPLFSLAGERVVLATHLIAALRTSEPGPVSGSLAGERDLIVRALDTLLAGV